MSAAACVTCAWTMLAGGCASTALPQPITPAQRDCVANTRFGFDVGVERFRFPVYSERLTAALAATQLFDRVDALASFATTPVYVARVARTIYGVAAVPWLTGLSFGVIPTTVDEEHGYAFSLTRTHAPVDQIAVEFRYEGPSTSGWQASYLNMFRNGTGGDVYHHPRVIEHLAWTIVQHREFIGQPLGDSCGTSMRPPFADARLGSHQALVGLSRSESGAPTGLRFE